MASDLTSRLGGARSSLAFKAPVRCATTANITLSGFQTIDGITPASGDANLRILVKDQTNAVNNGIYEMASGAWTRAKDFDGNDDFIKGTRVYVANGTTNGDTGWVVSTADPITVGTSSISFSAPGDEASVSAAEAAASASAAASSATSASTGASNASTSASAASTSASAAATSASSASTSASNASTSASAAATSASSASTSASNASTSASAASTSASAAATSAATAAAAAGFTHTYSTTTTMADPGSGVVRFNSLTLASISAAAVDDLSATGQDISARVTSWANSTNTDKGRLLWRKGSTFWIEFKVTGLTDNSGWTELALTYVGHEGTLSNTDELVSSFSPSGDEGSSAGDVAGPASATDNAAARYDLTTGKLLQDSALLIGDNADLTAYDATNDGNPVFAYGASATERLRIVPTYDTGAQTIDYVLFTTDVASASADKGLFRFSPDGSAVLDIDDGGINFAASKGISIAGTDIITDSAGTATLSNIDALDATTEATIEAAIDTLANLTSVQGRTVTLADAGANAIFGWDDTAGAYENLTAAEVKGVVGIPTSTTDNTLPRFDGTSGNIQTSGVTVDDSNNITGVGTITTTGGIELGHATDTTLSRSAAGELAVEGTVVKKVGKETVFIPAAAMTSRTTNGAASGTTELATNDVMLASLDFDQTTEEGAGFFIAMPKSWNESTVTFKPFWTAASGSGGVVWGLAAYSFSDDDALDTAVSGQQTSTDTLIATGDMHVGPESSAITIGGTPAEGDMVYFEITREVANGSDTLSGDAKLLGVHVYITTNASTDA